MASTCRGFNKDGVTPCSKLTTNPNGYCKTHQDQASHSGGGARTSRQPSSSSQSSSRSRSLSPASASTPRATGDARTCQGFNKDGVTPCSKLTTNPNGYCKTHQDQASHSGGGARTSRQPSSSSQSGAVLNSGITLFSTDLDGRTYAETADITKIAQGFSGLRYKAIDLVTSGVMTDYTRLYQVFGNFVDKPGNYLWCIKVARSDWIPIYLGKADGLGQRLRKYINKDGTFGPDGEHVKYAVMLNFQRRGFSIQVRPRPTYNQDAKDAESNTLSNFNFALNYYENGGYRRVLLPDNQSINNYPVKFPQGHFLNVLFAAERYKAIAGLKQPHDTVDLDA